MEITNNKVNLQLNSQTGVLVLTDLLIGTQVFLYDDSGVLQQKMLLTSRSLSITLNKRGVYVLVLHHPTCKIVVKRFTY
ncbi:MAG: hypothetical protein RR365_03690 [Bacteroides sp.]